MDSDNFLFNLKKFNKLIKKKLYKLAKCNSTCNQPSRLQSEILGNIIISHMENEIITQRDLEERLNVSRATISEALLKMEKNNYIKREKSKDDARINILKITDKSIYIYNKMQDDVSLLSKYIGSLLEKEELEEFNRIILKIIDKLDQEEN